MWYALLLIVDGYAAILVAARMQDYLIINRAYGTPWFNLIKLMLGLGGTFSLIGGVVLLVVAIGMAVLGRSI